MELRHFKYFVAVAEELNFGRAAARLHVVQPAVSKQVSNMEKELGVQLFYRNKREVRLTEVGRLFLEDARKVIEQAERAVATVDRAAKGEIGQLTVSFISPATLSVLPPIVNAFKKRYPEVELDLCKLTTAEQMEALQDGRVQLGFVREPAFHMNDGLNSMTVLEEPVLLALPENHPFSTSMKIPLKMLSEEPFIMFSSRLEPGLYERYMQIFREAGFIPKVIQETSHIQAILGFVASGLGLMLTPASLQKLGRDGVVYRELQEPPPEVELAAVWRREDDHLPVLKSFVDVVRDTVGDVHSIPAMR